MKQLFLTPIEVGLILNCDAQCFRSQARCNPEKLGFPVTVIGRKVRIPVEPFLAYWGMNETEMQERLQKGRERQRGHEE